MKSIIEELFHGNVAPGVSSIKPGSAYSDTLQEAAQAEKLLSNQLPDTQKEILEVFSKATTQLNYLTAVENFCEGFRLGALFMVEVFTASDWEDHK